MLFPKQNFVVSIIMSISAIRETQTHSMPALSFSPSKTVNNIINSSGNKPLTSIAFTAHALTFL